MTRPAQCFAFSEENLWTLNADNGFRENYSRAVLNDNALWYIKDAELPGWPVSIMIPGGHYALWGDGQQWYRFVSILPGETYYTKAARDVQKFGMAWIDPSWSGRDPQTAVFAPYITSGIAICIPSNGGYQEFVSPTHGWLSKNFFKTYARLAAVSGSGASLLVRSYSYTDGTDPMNPANLTYMGEVRLPLTKPDYVWQELKFAYPKPYPGSSKKVWTEISIVGGQPDTRVYIDEFNPISDQANISQHYPTYLPGDYDRDTIVNSEDLVTLGEGQIFDLLRADLVQGKQAEAIVRRLNENEFLPQWGVHSLSKVDKGYDPTDIDWGGPGVYAGDTPELAADLLSAGFTRKGIDVLQRILWWNAFPYIPQAVRADSRDYRRDGRANAIAALAGAQTVVWGLFGIRMEGNTLSICPVRDPYTAGMGVENLRIRGQIFRIQFDRNGKHCRVQTDGQNEHLPLGRPYRFSFSKLCGGFPAPGQGSDERPL